MSHEDYVVQPGSNEFVLQIGRESGVDVVLKDGGTTLPWPDGVMVQIKDASGASVVASRHRHGPPGPSP